MAVQITIIGLGQIGASLGLALAGQSNLVQRVGHDRQIARARQAEKLGALDKVEINLPKAVREADVVLLCLPMDEIRETLAIIAQDVKAGAVVMDTAPIKEVVAAWASEMLPPERYYVGLTPVLNPAYLHTAESGQDAAHADLFRGGLIGIVTPPRASSEAIKLAADLTRLIGATPLFADPMEMDSLMAATHLLPQLMAAALLNATVDQPGWREARKVAGRAYAEATGPLVQLSGSRALASTVFLNKDTMLRVMDGVLATMQAIRHDIESGDQAALQDKLERAEVGRQRWWSQRQAGDWLNAEGEASPSADIPSASDIFGRLLGMGRKPKK